MEKLSVKNVEEQVAAFDKMKFIDEDGKEKISGRDLSKALGYTDFRNFKKAVSRANDQIEKSGKDKDSMIVEVTTHREVNHSGASKGKESREVIDYHLTRRQAINVANNADTSKPEVAMVQEWLYDNSEVGERAKNIYNKLKDKEYIDERNGLKQINRELNATLLQHDVKEEELGIVADAGDKGMFDMSTKDLKKENNIPDNRPVADFLGSEMTTAKKFAQQLTNQDIKNNNKNGVNECADAAYSNNRVVRDLITEHYKETPENLITGEDVKKVEQRYKNLTKKQLKAIEQEF